MVVGRVSATDELLTGPLSESPCVGYFLEVAEWGFTGDILNNKGYGYKRIYSERRNVAFNISDPSAPDKVVEIPATEEFAYGVNDIPDTKQRSFELLTDVVVAHICPSTLMYEVPHIYDGDIQATKNLIRGYPMRFGMLDGEGEGDRVELPLNIDELLLKCNAKRYRKTKWAILKSFFGCGSGDTRYGESIKGGSSVKSNASDFYDTKLLICEMSIRVNDQMNVVATFKEGAKNKLVASHVS